MNNVLAVVLAGGKGSRLDPLTRDRAKPAVPFGGAYRIVDFTLSNCLNSGIRKILILTQYKAASLTRHIHMGWQSLFCRELQEFVDVVPPQQRIDESWYRGTADAVYQNIYTMEKEHSEYTVILAGDHIYKMDYQKMVQTHIENQADATIGVLHVPVEEAANRFGVMELTPKLNVIGFEEKPDHPKPIHDDPTHCYASMGIYVFNTRFLFDQLC
ncbi:MAG: sugar phosphate nucleotidyltransferase, partial [Planctomycetia bacterium]